MKNNKYITKSDSRKYIEGIKNRSHSPRDDEDFNKIVKLILKGKCVNIYYYILDYDLQELNIELDFYFTDKDEALLLLKDLDITINYSNESKVANIFFISTSIRIYDQNINLEDNDGIFSGLFKLLRDKFESHIK